MSKNNTLEFIWEVFKIIVIAAVIVVPIRYFLFQPFFVRGESMIPNFKDGDYLIIDEISYRFREPQRGEVIVFKYPEDPSSRFIKRIIGLPGETVQIKDGNILITDKEKRSLREDYLPLGLITVGEIKTILKDNEYFVLGDNRPYSYDSRRFGPLPEKYIIGKVFFRAWPLDSASMFEAPLY